MGINFLIFVRSIESLKSRHIFAGMRLKYIARFVSTIDSVLCAFYHAIEGFKHCIPIICVDAIAMIGKYGGTLMTALSFDGSNNIFLLAYGLTNN